MRTALWFILILAAATVATFAANPAFQSFDTNDFIITPSLSNPKLIHVNRANTTNSFTNSVITYTNTTIIQNFTTNIFDNSTIINTNTVITNSYVTNFFDNSVIIITNTQITINGSNVSTINPTDGYLPYRTGTNSFGDSSLRQTAPTITEGILIGAIQINATNLLSTEGAFVTSALGVTLATPGTNQISLLNKSLEVIASSDTNGVFIEISSGMGQGQHAWLVNYWTNAAFTLLSGVCYDDTNKVVVVRGGAWTPTEVGESIELLGMPQGWVELGRSNPNGPAPVTGTNHWEVLSGSLQPVDLTLPLFWTNNLIAGGIYSGGPGYGEVFVESPSMGDNIDLFADDTDDFQITMADSGTTEALAIRPRKHSTPLIMANSTITRTNGESLLALKNMGTNWFDVGNIGQIIFGPGTTNVLQRSARDLTYTNSGTSAAFTVIDGSGESISMTASTNPRLSSSSGTSLFLQSANGVALERTVGAPIWYFGAAAGNDLITATDGVGSIGGIGNNRPANVRVTTAIWTPKVIYNQPTNTVFDAAGFGTPEGAVAADVGSTYRRYDGGAVTSFYVKETGSGNTGWVGK